MKKTTNLIGQTFGALVVTGFAFRNKHSQVEWQCHCQCGNEVIIPTGSLTQGLTKSCKCLRSKSISDNLAVHGMSGTKVYRKWKALNQRCNDPNSAGFPMYGARGIKVCERWRKFENFYADMGDMPTPQHTVDRIDSNGDYCPGNCRWATMKQQQNNKSTNRVITHNGQSMTLAEWCETLNLPYERIRGRLRNGFSFEEAVTKTLWSKRPQPLG